MNGDCHKKNVVSTLMFLWLYHLNSALHLPRFPLFLMAIT
jgi:hypothetical protein